MISAFVALYLSSAYAATCNQEVYDTAYRSILEQALVDNDLQKRNNTIRTLRELCNGQRSTIEQTNHKYQLWRPHVYGQE